MERGSGKTGGVSGSRGGRGRNQNGGGGRNQNGGGRNQNGGGRNQDGGGRNQDGGGGRHQDGGGRNQNGGGGGSRNNGGGVWSGNESGEAFDSNQSSGGWDINQSGGGYNARGSGRTQRGGRNDSCSGNGPGDTQNGGPGGDDRGSARSCGAQRQSRDYQQHQQSPNSWQHENQNQWRGPIQGAVQCPQLQPQQLAARGGYVGRGGGGGRGGGRGGGGRGGGGARWVANKTEGGFNTSAGGSGVVSPVQPRGVSPVQPLGVSAMQPQGVSPVQPLGVSAMQPQGVSPVQPQAVPISHDPVRDPISVETASISPTPSLSSSSASGKNGKMVPVRRPDKGGVANIRHVTLRVNHFPVKFNPDTIIKHYDVDVKVDGTTKSGHPVKVPKSLLPQIRNKLFSDYPGDFPLSMTAYDGDKNIFSAVTLPTGKYKVEFSEDTQITTYTYTIKQVNELKLCKLKDYLNGNVFSVPRDILQGMDIVMKENPTKRMIWAGRSFHSHETHPQDDLGYGLIASRGYQHTLKPTSQGLVMCLDYSVLAFRKPLPVIEYLNQHIRGFDIKQFMKFRRDVDIALRSLKVRVIHRRTKQKYTIAGLTSKITRDLDFKFLDPEGASPPRQVMLVDYFKDKYKKDIMHKDIPSLDLGKPGKRNDVPMEFCVLVEGQVYPKEELDQNAGFMLKDISLAKPNVRETIIREMVRGEGGPSGGDVIKNFGMEVNMDMTSVFGRILGPPVLKLGSNGKLISVKVDQNRCQWNLVGRGMVEGKAVKRWAVIDFSAYDRNRLNANMFIPKLIDRCRSLGMQMEEPLLYTQTTMNKLSNMNLLQEILEGCVKEASKSGQLQLILCVMSRKDEGYKNLKWISETKIGVVTQCCLSNLANKLQDQYLANLGLKINAKLGGSNSELMNRLPFFEGDARVMFIGADVNHPRARDLSSPSIAAVVATINWPAANRYAARVHAQCHRKEKIVKFGDMCMDLVETYARLNGGRPKKIVIFRDGVSEGQFDMVLNEELVDFKLRCQNISYYPSVTVIVAQKRHQTRFFPEGREGGPTGNVPPGTVVDKTVVHPFEFDFYLCSHYGGIGTSKPTHYHVLWDEHKFSSDQLQKLIYDMCFTYARCTKPVSLVPPVYYADLVAYRGRMYHEALNNVDPGSKPFSPSISKSFSPSISTSEVSFDEKFYKLHTDLENIMFFV